MTERQPGDAVVNPRLTDQLGLDLVQEDVPFAIPHLREDLPFALDPFLLWKSDDEHYRSMHCELLAFFAELRRLLEARQRGAARDQLLHCSEAVELGLGYGQGTKRGSAIGPKLAEAILDTFLEVPQLAETDIAHVEMLGLVVPLVAEDRISDITASILRRHLIAYTADQATALAIPTVSFRLDSVWHADTLEWRATTAHLPANPLDGSPLLFAPLDLLRHLTWINYEDYYKSAFARLVLPPDLAKRKVAKAAVLERNRRNFVAVERYVEHKEATSAACAPDPLFQPLRLTTLRSKLASLRKLPTGKDDGADKKYEDLAFDILESALYPDLDFADSQVRTDGGVHIRDAIFYNDGKSGFLRDLREEYGAQQIVFELKNVAKLAGGYVNQLHRYLDDGFGKVGVLVTRRALPKSIEKNIVDLHSSKRVVILVLDDTDLAMMLDFIGTSRRPVDVLKKRYVEFTRRLPK